MIYKILTIKSVDKVVSKWKKSNPAKFKKYGQILHELMEHPRTGLFHPEPLKGGDDITWSRHISAKDRIIYEIYDEHIKVIIVQVEDHYNDK